MKTFNLTLTEFPKELNDVVALRFSEKALIRGAIAAGQSPRKHVTALDQKAHLDGLAALIRSSLDTSGSNLCPTDHFKGLGSTEMGNKSFGIGNALCALTAYKKLGIPWLMDIEKLPKRISVTKGINSNQRPDFIGKDTQGNWYVFESKGRTRKPSKADLIAWKKQVKTVHMINGIKPVYSIVSAAYLNAKKVWEVIWVDPASDDGEEVNFSEQMFFENYYHQLFSALQSEPKILDIFEYGPMIRLPESGIDVGLHLDVFNALRTGDFAGIVEFGRRNLEVQENFDTKGVTVFPDGIIVRINDGAPPHERLQQKPRYKPKPSAHDA